jgi:LacI family transcriptional regulator
MEEMDYRPNIFAKNLRLSKTFTFGVLMPKPSQDSRYWTIPIRGMTKAQNELSSQKVNVHFFFYDKYSEESFNRVSKDAIQAKLEGLLIAPVLSKIFDKFVQEIPSHLPYIFFDSFIPNANYLSYIGQDSFQSGVLAARLMQMMIKQKGSLVVVKVLPEDYHIEDRTNGFLFFCRNCPGIEAKVYELDSHRSSSIRNALFKRIVFENQDLRGIFVTNASTHQVAEFIKSQSLPEKIYIIGYDLIEENIHYLKEGVIDFLISQQSERQGYEGLYSLYRHVVLKAPIEKKIMMQIDIVTKENIDYYQS